MRSSKALSGRRADRLHIRTASDTDPYKIPSYPRNPWFTNDSCLLVFIGG